MKRIALRNRRGKEMEEAKRISKKKKIKDSVDESTLHALLGGLFDHLLV